MRWFALCLAFVAATAAADLAPWTRTEFPQDKDKWWWDADWWARGRIPQAENHAVAVRESAFRNGDVEVPTRVYRPEGAHRYPVIVFMHGRRGIDELTRLIPLRLAAHALHDADFRFDLRIVDYDLQQEAVEL